MLHLIKEALLLTQDLVVPATPIDILSGERLFRPFIRYQHNWMRYFYPHEDLLSTHDSWHYLQKYMMPLIKKHASSYHIDGIKLLTLDAEIKPEFNTFKRLFEERSQGFTIEKVDKEIAPKEYFELIHQKRFPCINKMRDHEELFCANEPDFWHEAIGHIAPLCFKEVQEFYLAIAETILSAQTIEEFNQHLAVAWVLLEYGFLKQNGANKMFGAALVGSHLANMRYEKGLINIEPANRELILDSGFYEEDKPIAKDEHGRFRFFCLETLTLDQIFSV